VFEEKCYFNCSSVYETSIKTTRSCHACLGYEELDSKDDCLYQGDSPDDGGSKHL
jgi:hypothetical protein